MCSMPCGSSHGVRKRLARARTQTTRRQRAWNSRSEVGRPAKKIYSSKESGEDDEDSVLAPYWAVDFAKAEEKPNMDLKPVYIKLAKLGDVMGLSLGALKLCAPAEGNAVLTIFALTNTRRVKAGEVLLRKQK